MEFMTLSGMVSGLLFGYAGYRIITKPEMRYRKKGKTQKKIIKLFLGMWILFGIYVALQRYCLPLTEKNVSEDTEISSHKSSTVSPLIDVCEKTIGEGKEKITYFAAEIQLGDATDLKAAFANNQYGLNIRETVSAMAENHGAAFAFNGDYYGNRTDGMVIRDGILYRDKSGGRESLVLYRDGTAGIVQEGTVTGETLLENGAWNVFSFGPVLIEKGKIRENLDGSYKVDEMSVSITDKNPRTGIGFLGKNHLLVIVVDGRNEGYSCGMTLQEFAQLFADYGCELAYNLDGGSSVTLYQNGKILNRPCTSSGDEREISDMIYIK